MKKFLKISLIIILVVIGVFLIISGISKISKAANEKVSNAFITQFNKVSNLAEDIVKTSALDLSGLAEKEAAKDFSGALSIVQQAMNKNSETTEKLKNLTSETIDFKKLAQKISDEAAQKSALAVTIIIEKNNELSAEYLAIQKQILEKAIAYYQSSQQGAKASLPADFVSLGQKAQQISAELQKLTPLYAEALKNLVRDAELNAVKK
jgi:hypothetical protein